MKYNIETNKQHNKVYVTVAVKRREKIKQDVVAVYTSDVVKYINENYNPPAAYNLGECLSDPNMSANNLEDKHLVKTWVFSLTKKQVKKTSTKTQGTTKKS